MKAIKQSTAVTIVIGPAVGIADAVTKKTGLTAAGATVFAVYKNGASSAVDITGTSTLTHIGNGMYTMTLLTGDTDTAGNLRIVYSKPDTCMDIVTDCLVYPANIYDSLFGSDKLQIDVSQWLGVTVTAGTGNRPAVDSAGIGGSTSAATRMAAAAVGIISAAVDDLTASNTAFVTDLTETTDNHYSGRTVVFTSGALSGQASSISGYDGSTKTLTVAALTEAPGNADTFVIV